MNEAAEPLNHCRRSEASDPGVVSHHVNTATRKRMNGGQTDVTKLLIKSDLGLLNKGGLCQQCSFYDRLSSTATQNVLSPCL